MILDRNMDAVGDWWFEDRRKSVSPTSRAALIELIKMCQSVAEILEDYRLLRPSKVIFSGWLCSESNQETLYRVEDPDITVEIPRHLNARFLLNCCEKVLPQLERDYSFLYPIDLEILGTGIIIDADGQEKELPNVTWLLGKTLDAHIVDVLTQSDAWLPYTFLAEPQPEVWKCNAPRLEAALKEIQKRLEIIPVTDSHSEYAIIENLQLRNHVDADGEIIPVYNQMASRLR
ncbi:MAG: hypothetical protein F6K47_34670 [Symploca sp. SIO2E6]|nr:hypothetical protein [Symploca sp. SIO2E6]